MLKRRDIVTGDEIIEVGGGELSLPTGAREDASKRPALTPVDERSFALGPNQTGMTKPARDTLSRSFLPPTLENLRLQGASLHYYRHP